MPTSRPARIIWKLVRSGSHYKLRLDDGPTVSAIGHRWIFCSVRWPVSPEKTAIGVILTGMGKDGSSGLLDMRNAGAITLGQDEASSLIYGMPRAAFENGAVMKQVALSHMADAILDACESHPITQPRDKQPTHAVRLDETNATRVELLKCRSQP